MIEPLSFIIFSTLSLIYLSLVVGLFLPERKKNDRKFLPKISILIPAHNEERTINKTVESVIKANYPNQKEIIVINDGSTDATAKIVKSMSRKFSEVRLINLPHRGKAAALNEGLKIAKNDVIITIDGDSILKNDALVELVHPLNEEKVAGVTGVVRAQRTSNPLTFYQDFEYMLSSGWRYICTKLNANTILPGFAAFKKRALLKVGGFSGDTLTEDFDIGISLRRAGYQTLTITSATIYTKTPMSIGGFIKQRIRWARGTFQVVKKHFKFIFSKKSGNIKFFSIPTQLYWYFHPFIYLPLTFYTFFEGLITYFFSKGILVSFASLKYIFSWFSLYGIGEMAYKFFLGYYPFNLLMALLLFMFSLSLVYTIGVWSRISLKLKDLFIYLFYFPYSIFVLTIHFFSVIYYLSYPKAYGKWEK